MNGGGVEGEAGPQGSQGSWAAAPIPPQWTMLPARSCSGEDHSCLLLVWWGSPFVAMEIPASELRVVLPGTPKGRYPSGGTRCGLRPTAALCGPFLPPPPILACPCSPVSRPLPICSSLLPDWSEPFQVGCVALGPGSWVLAQVLGPEGVLWSKHSVPVGSTSQETGRAMVWLGGR